MSPSNERRLVRSIKSSALLGVVFRRPIRRPGWLAWPDIDELWSGSTCLTDTSGLMADSLSEARLWFGSTPDAPAGALVSLATPTEHATVLVGELVGDPPRQLDDRWLSDRAVRNLLSKRQPDEGRIIGWDVLALDGPDLHSWLCDAKGQAAAEAAGVSPGDNGLFVTAGDAARLAEAAGAVIGNRNGEYSSWLPVALVLHPDIHVPDVSFSFHEMVLGEPA